MPSCSGVAVGIEVLLGALEGTVAPDQGIGRRVVCELGVGIALELGDDLGRERLAELDAPLIERVDPPDGALGEDAVLVQRDECPEEAGGQ